jgi:hypothetical protein
MLPRRRAMADDLIQKGYLLPTGYDGGQLKR